MMLTPDDITEYQKECLRRVNWVAVSYEGQPVCPECCEPMEKCAAHVCDRCARLLLEGEVTERVRNESNG